MTHQSHRYRAFVFDLDGTLIDSAPDIAAALNRVFERRGWPTQSVAVVEKFIGFGARRLVHDLLHSLDLPCDGATIDAVLQEYLANYARTPADKTLFYPHVREDLAALRHAGLRLGICTNKPQELAFKVLGILGIVDLFDAVVGADAVPASKPDPAHLMAVARRMELVGQPWAYVGDTSVDKATAAAAGVPFYAVPWGTGRNLDVEPSMRLTRLRDLDGAQASGLGN